MRQALESVARVRRITLPTWVAPSRCCKSWWNKQVEGGRFQSHVLEWESQGISLLLLDGKFYPWCFWSSDLCTQAGIGMISVSHSETFTLRLKNITGFPGSPGCRGYKSSQLP